MCATLLINYRFSRWKVDLLSVYLITHSQWNKSVCITYVTEASLIHVSMQWDMGVGHSCYLKVEILVIYITTPPWNVACASAVLLPWPGSVRALSRFEIQISGVWDMAITDRILIGFLPHDCAHSNQTSARGNMEYIACYAGIVVATLHTQTIYRSPICSYR